MYMNNGSSILRIVNGLSKTLNIANQMVPLYKQVKPLISNSGKILSGIKSFNSAKPNAAATPQKMTTNNNPNYTQPAPVVAPVNVSLPTFFQ